MAEKNDLNISKHNQTILENHTTELSHKLRKEQSSHLQKYFSEISLTSILEWFKQ